MIINRWLPITEPPGAIAFDAIMSLHPVSSTFGSTRYWGRGGLEIWAKLKPNAGVSLIFVKALSERQDLNITGFAQAYLLSGSNKSLKHNYSCDQQTAAFLRALIC